MGWEEGMSEWEVWVGGLMERERRERRVCSPSAVPLRAYREQ